MRPRNTVQSVILYTQQTNDGDYIPRRVEVNSWVALYSRKRGGHARDSMKYGVTTIAGAYKAKVLEFDIAPGSRKVKTVKVMHAYMHRQLQLQPNVAATLDGACNYLYPSTHVDWIDPLSIIEPICVVHAEVGKASRGDQNHWELLNDSVFFYDAYYHPVQGGYGRVETIPLPDLGDPSWPLPDMDTSEAFRARLRDDFRMSMKPYTGSRATHISWFMPIAVMVDLFACAPSVHKTRTLFVFKEILNELFDSLMDQEWNEKAVFGADEIKCKVDPQTLSFKYHIGRSTLYANFQYNRWRVVGGNGQQMNQSQVVEVVTVDCELGDWKQGIQVGSSWTLDSIRSEIYMLLGTTDFSMHVLQDGYPTKRVNRRNEKRRVAAQVLPPKKLQLVPYQFANMVEIRGQQERHGLRKPSTCAP